MVNLEYRCQTGFDQVCYDLLLNRPLTTGLVKSLDELGQNILNCYQHRLITGPTVFFSPFAKVLKCQNRSVLAKLMEQTNIFCLHLHWFIIACLEALHSQGFSIDTKPTINQVPLFNRHWLPTVFNAESNFCLQFCSAKDNMSSIQIRKSIKVNLFASKRKEKSNHHVKGVNIKFTLVFLCQVQNLMVPLIKFK